MAQVTITLDQAGAPPGVAGFAREDFVTGIPVTATASVGSSYAWTITWKPVNVKTSTRSAAALSAPGASSTQITPIDKIGTYRLAIAVDQGSGLGANPEDNAAITFYAGPTLNPAAVEFPRRVPAFGETTEHNVPDAIDPSGNVDGWAREWQRWFVAIESGGVKTEWSTQVHWWVDPTNGDDSNDGTAQVQGAGTVGPLKTLTEHFRRIIAAGGYRTPNTVVDILGDTAANDEPRGLVNVYSGANILYRGINGITPIRTGTFSAVTIANPATNQGLVATDSVGATWTAYTVNTANGVRVRNTTAGPRNGMTFWPGLDLTAGQCRFSQPYPVIDTTLGAFGQAALPATELVVNDTYVLEQIPIIQGAWGIQFNVDSTNGIGASLQEAVQFANLCMTDTAFAKIPVFVCNGYGSIAFFNCDIGPMKIQAPFRTLVNCRRCTLLDQVDGGMSLLGTEYIRAGLSRRVLNFNGPQYVVIDQRHYAGGGIAVQSGRILVESVQCWSAGFGLVAYGGDVVFRTATPQEVFGSAGGYGMLFTNGTIGRYDIKTGLTLTGSTADLGFGPSTAIVSKTYADLPFLLPGVTTFGGLIHT